MGKPLSLEKNTMEISLEISMYPLNEEYKQQILAFIDGLNSYENLEVITNPMSTQVFGDFEEVMHAFTIETKKVFTDISRVMMVTKIFNHNLLDA